MADLNSVWDDNDLAEFDNAPVAEGRAGPIPPDDYLLAVERQELKPTKDNTGVILSLMFNVMEGQYEGRKVFANLNVKNKNAQAQQIGMGEFKALCIACGLDVADVKNETDYLTGVPFRAKVGLEKPREGYEQRNEIKKYYPADNAPPAPAQAPAPRPPAAAPAARTAPAPTRAVPAFMQRKTA